MNPPKSTARRVCGCIGKCLQFISMGQFSLGLYYNRRIQYSSVIGGILSILFGAIMIAYSFITLQSVFNRDNYMLESKNVDIAEHPKVYNSTFIEFSELFQHSIGVHVKTTNESVCQDYINIKVELIGNYSGKTPTPLGNYKTNLYLIHDDYIYCYFDPYRHADFLAAIGNISDQRAIQSDSLGFYQGYYYRFKYEVVSTTNYLSNLFIRFNGSEISTLGEQQLTQNKFLDIQKNVFMLTFQIIKYQTTDSILGINYQFEEKYVFSQNPQIDEFNTTFDQEFQIWIMFENLIIEEKHYPQSIFVGLARIGGILGIVKIVSALIRYSHQRLFERNLRRFHNANKFHVQNSFATSSDKKYQNINMTEFSENQDQQLLMPQPQKDKIEDFYSFQNFRDMNNWNCDSNKIDDNGVQIQLQELRASVTRDLEAKDYEIQQLKLELQRQRQEHEQLISELNLKK